MDTAGRPGLPGRVLPGVLLFGVIAAGALVWFLAREDEPNSSQADPGMGPTAGTLQRADPNTNAGTERRIREAGTQAGGRGLPRVLPPDAAVEDVRDALALPAKERGEALERARDAMLRLAQDDEKVVRGLRTYTDAVEDEVVRAVVLASLGTLRTDAHRRWLCEQVEGAPSAAERIGALIALAHPSDVRTDKRKGEAGSAEAALLGGLAYRHDAIPPTSMATKAVSHWLRRGKAEEARAGLPILLRCVREYDNWAALLVGEDGRMRAWFALLSLQDRARVKSAALAHANLSQEVRAAISAAE